MKFNTNYIYKLNRLNLFRINKLFKNDALKWVFIGNFSNYLRTRKYFATNNEILVKPLNSYGEKISQEYIEYIGELDLKYNSINWWQSMISEKQPSISKMFFNLSSFEKAKEIIKSERNVVIIVDSRQLYQLIKNLTGDKRIYRFTFYKVVLPYLYLPLIIFKRLIFLFKEYRKVIIAKLFLRRYFENLKKRSKNEALILVNTWFDERSIKDDNYHDSYFECLIDHSNKENIAVIPYIMPNIRFSKAIKFIRENKNYNFIVPQLFFSFIDLIKISFPKFYLIKANIYNQDFKNIDISNLFFSDLLSDLVSNRIPSIKLFYELPFKLRKNGFEVKRVIYPFENHSWEKLYILGFDQTYPNIKTLGYQHSSISKFKLNYFISQKEMNIVPLPSLIVTTGNKPKEILDKFYGNKVKTGGAIRYQHLFEQKKDKMQTSGNKVLLATSMDQEEVSELINKAIAGLSGVDVEVVIKPHPALSTGKLWFKNTLNRLPSNFRLNTNRKDQLESFDLVIVTSSTIALEAIAFNIPVICVELDFSIVDAPLVDTDGTTFNVQTPVELRQKVEYICKNKEHIINDKKMLWKNVIESYFNSDFKEGYDILLEG